MEVIIDNTVFPPRKYFKDVDSRLINFKTKCRVIPANYFDSPNTFFELKAKYEPGENRFFPNGGFEIVHSEGGIYNYELDQVVVHPYDVGLRKYFSKSEDVKVKEKITSTDPNSPKRGRGRPKLDPSQLKNQKTYVSTGRGRGRPPLDPSLKKTTEPKASSGKGRGRPALDPVIKAQREAEKTKRAQISGGRRGRPKKI